MRPETRLLKLDSIVDIPTDEEDDTLRDLEASATKSSIRILSEGS